MVTKGDYMTNTVDSMISNNAVDIEGANNLLDDFNIDELELMMSNDDNHHVINSVDELKDVEIVIRDDNMSIDFEIGNVGDSVPTNECVNVEIEEKTVSDVKTEDIEDIIGSIDNDKITVIVEEPVEPVNVEVVNIEPVIQKTETVVEAVEDVDVVDVVSEILDVDDNTCLPVEDVIEEADTFGLNSDTVEQQDVDVYVSTDVPKVVEVDVVKTKPVKAEIVEVKVEDDQKVGKRSRKSKLQKEKERKAQELGMRLLNGEILQEDIDVISNVTPVTTHGVTTGTNIDVDLSVDDVMGNLAKVLGGFAKHGITINVENININLK